MTVPENTQEILQRFHAIVEQEAPRNTGLNRDAEAMLDEFLTRGAKRIVAERPKGREMLLAESEATLRRAVSAASASIDRARMQRAANLGFPDTWESQRVVVSGQEMSEFMAEFGPIPPFC